MTLSKIHWALILCITPFLLTLGLNFTDITDSLENNLLDLRYRFANPEHPFSDKIVIVDVDETTMDVYKDSPLFGRWPWKRNVYKPILEHIAAGNPKLVLFDIMFFEQSGIDCNNVSYDDDLVEATMNLGVVSHAINLNKENLEPEVDKAYETGVPENVLNKALKIENAGLLNLSTYNILQFPIPDISNFAPHFHAVTYVPDHDGVGRRGYLFFKYRDSYFPSLALKGYLSQYPAEKISVEGSNIKIVSKNLTQDIPTEKSAFRLHYYSESTINNMPRISMSGIIDSVRALDAGEIDDPSKLKVPFSAFQDKVVIIGTSAASTSDTRLTPYGDRPGYMYHAILYSNLMQGHFLHMSPDWVGFLVLLILLPFNVYLSIYSKSIAIRIAAPGSIMILYPLLAFVAFKYDYHLPLSEFAIAYPITFLGSLAYLTLTEGAEKESIVKYSPTWWTLPLLVKH